MLFILILITVVYILYKMNTEQNSFKVQIYIRGPKKNFINSHMHFGFQILSLWGNNFG